MLIKNQVLFLSSNALVIREEDLVSILAQRDTSQFMQNICNQQSILEATPQCLPAYIKNRAICEDFTSMWHFFQHREDILHLQLHPRRQLTFPLYKPNILHPFYPQRGKHLLCRLSAGGRTQARLSNWCASENTLELLGFINQLPSFSLKTGAHIHWYNACHNFTWIYVHQCAMDIHFRGTWMYLQP